MNIPTEYYEEEYLEFEKYLEFTGKKPSNKKELDMETADFYLEQFRKYELFSKFHDKMVQRRLPKKDKKHSEVKKRNKAQDDIVDKDKHVHVKTKVEKKIASVS